MNIGKYIPWAAIGQIIGAVIVIPLGYYLINKFYYSNKYNNDAEIYASSFMNNSMDVEVFMPHYDSKRYLENVDENALTIETFKIKEGGNYFANPEAIYIPFFSTEYKKYFSVMFFMYNKTYGYDEKKVLLTVNKDDMTNPKYGTKENPVPVLKMVGVHESIRDNNKDYDKAYMDSFYRNNVIMYLKYKMSKEEFERRFKHKE